MDLSNHEHLPEYPESSEVEKYCFAILDEANREPTQDTIQKLQAIGDKQWHTYQLPSIELQAALKKWLIQNWISNSDDYLEAILYLAFNFGLDKEFYTKALSLYEGRFEGEYQRALDNSSGDFIDPWWSMKEQGNK